MDSETLRQPPVNVVYALKVWTQIPSEAAVFLRVPESGKGVSTGTAV